MNYITTRVHTSLLPVFADWVHLETQIISWLAVDGHCAKGSHHWVHCIHWVYASQQSYWMA